MIDPSVFDIEVAELHCKFLAASAADLEASAKHPPHERKEARKTIIPNRCESEVGLALVPTAKKIGASWSSRFGE